MELNPHRRHRDSPGQRSRSPRTRDAHRDVTKRRSRSPHHHSHSNHHRRSKATLDRPLPCNARSLHKRDYGGYKALFAEYLSLQKQLDIDALGADEVRGRWKSFLGKWNRGKLAEGWYDPETKSKSNERYATGEEDAIASSSYAVASKPGRPAADDDKDEDDEGYGPALPATTDKHLGPAVPRVQDLQHRQELLEEDRNLHRADIRHERKLDRKAQKERLEELVPRAEPGSRERQLEKKKEKASTNRDFREAKEPGGMEEVGESELMGGGEDEFRTKLKSREKIKNERELKKEEVLRARAAEREEKMMAVRKKEEKTMDMLKELAKQRYG